MEYVLQTRALTKRYRDFTALDRFTMRIPKGAIYGFVGRNGAGKTTLIRLICGLQEPTEGDYTLYGVRNTEPDIIRSRRRMGAVVESPAIYLHMTARENIRQQYLVLGLPSDDGIDELLRLVVELVVIDLHRAERVFEEPSRRVVEPECIRRNGVCVVRLRLLERQLVLRRRVRARIVDRRAALEMAVAEISFLRLDVHGAKVIVVDDRGHAYTSHVMKYACVLSLSS